MTQYTGSTIGPELTVEFWNTVFGSLPMFPTVSEPTATPTSVVAIIGLIGVSALLFILGRLGDRKQSGEPGDGQAYYETGESGEMGLFDDIEELQKTIISAEAYEDDTRMPQLGDEQYIQTFFVPAEMYGNVPVDGYLEPVFETTEAKYDLLIYFDKQDRSRTEARLDSKVTTAMAETETSSVAELSGKANRLGRLADLYQEVENGQTPYKISTYITIRGSTKEELADARSKLKQVFQDYPVQQPLQTPVGQQKQALQSTLPIGRDVLGDTDKARFKNTTVAGAFGAAYASVIKPTKVVPKGVEYGKHKSTGLPLVLDPWGHDAGNAMVMVADPGGGKSTTGKALMQRILTQREDVIGVTIEPMGNWAGVAEVFKSEREDPGEYEGAEHITVNGDVGVNPLQIREIPPEKRKDLPEDADPLSDRKEVAISFLETLFKMRGNGRRFSEYRVVCENAINDAYHAKNIYHDDLDSHGRESPTLREVRNEQLKDRFENPEQYADEGFQKKEIQKAAQWLYSQFQIFDVREGENSQEIKGVYSDLGKNTEFDIYGNKYVYLDLGQSEGNVSEKAQLTMQILLDQVYEMSKQTDKKVVLAMDEFRHFIRDVANIDSIENLFRHHRHQDIAPWIMTQTVHEFLERSESETILDMCPYFMGQRYDKMTEDDAQKLGLTKSQYEFVHNEAQPGTPDRGYADALLLSGDAGRKLEIHLTPSELQVSEWDREDPDEWLPGVTSHDKQSLYEDADTDPTPESEQNASGSRASSQRRGETVQFESERSTVETDVATMETTPTEGTTEEDAEDRSDNENTGPEIGSQPAVESNTDDKDDSSETGSEGEDEDRSRVDRLLNTFLDRFEDGDGTDEGDTSNRSDNGSGVPIDGPSIEEVGKQTETEPTSEAEGVSGESTDGLVDSTNEGGSSKQGGVGSVLTAAVGQISHTVGSLIGDDDSEDETPDDGEGSGFNPQSVSELGEGTETEAEPRREPEPADYDSQSGDNIKETETSTSEVSDRPQWDDEPEAVEPEDTTSEPEPKGVEDTDTELDTDQNQMDSTATTSTNSSQASGSTTPEQPSGDIAVEYRGETHSTEAIEDRDEPDSEDTEGGETTRVSEPEPEPDAELESDPEPGSVAEVASELATVLAESDPEGETGEAVDREVTEAKNDEPGPNNSASEGDETRQELTPPSFASVGESDESGDDEDVDSEDQVDSDTEVAGSVEQTSEKTPPSFSTIGSGEQQKTVDPEPSDCTPTPQQSSGETAAQSDSRNTDTLKRPSFASDGQDGDEGNVDETTTEADRPDSATASNERFGRINDTGGGEMESEGESGDISFLLDSESREMIGEEEESTPDDPFASFDSSDDESDETDENLGFLVSDDDQGEDSEEQAPEEKPATDGGWGEW